MKRVLLVLLVALVLPATAAAQQKQVKPDRAAIDRLLDEFIPNVVAGKNPSVGRKLVAGYLTTSGYFAGLKSRAINRFT